MTGPGLPAPTGSPYRIGFVCLGNICRSPMADVVMSQLVDDAGLSSRVEVTSSGTGDWHLGHPMDSRAAATLLAEDYDPSAHRAQQWTSAWSDRDLLLAMDHQNLADIGGPSERVRLFRTFDPLVDSTDPPDVPDPYYGGEDGFAETLAIVERTCRAILRELESLDLG